MYKNWKNRIRQLKSEILTLYFAYRDPRTPWYARIFTAIVVSYALSPIDLIPDFIPIFGILDDLVIVPLGLLLAIKMIPASVMVDSKQKAHEMASGQMPVSREAAIAIVFIWLLLVILGVVYSVRLIESMK